MNERNVDRLYFIYDYLLLLLYNKKSQVQLAEVAPMARRRDTLFEESEAVRLQMKNKKLRSPKTIIGGCA